MYYTQARRCESPNPVASKTCVRQNHRCQPQGVKDTVEDTPKCLRCLVRMQTLSNCASLLVSGSDLSRQAAQCPFRAPRLAGAPATSVATWDGSLAGHRPLSKVDGCKGRAHWHPHGVGPFSPHEGSVAVLKDRFHTVHTWQRNSSWPVRLAMCKAVVGSHARWAKEGHRHRHAIGDRYSLLSWSLEREIELSHLATGGVRRPIERFLAWFRNPTESGYTGTHTIIVTLALACWRHCWSRR